MMGAGWFVLVSGEGGSYQPKTFFRRDFRIFLMNRQISVSLDTSLTVSESECEIPVKRQHLGEKSAKFSKRWQNLVST